MEDFVRDIKDQIIAMEEITLDELNARNNKLNTLPIIYVMLTYIF